MTDSQVVRLVLNGEIDAYEEIIRRYQKRIFILAYRFVWNKEEAEDIAQEVFMKSYKNLKHFDQSREFYPWLHKVAINTVFTCLKQRSGRKNEIEFIEEMHGDEKYSPEKAVEQRKESEQVASALNSLPPRYQIVLALREIEGLNYSEIAEQADCSIGTVMSRLNRGRKKLWEKLKRRTS
ncbi:MAG: sigma-70 family RNA polymerase sigma factor [bacterium]